jgi:sarcosine oxidase delta subunit
VADYATIEITCPFCGHPRVNEIPPIILECPHCFRGWEADFTEALRAKYKEGQE